MKQSLMIVLLLIVTACSTSSQNQAVVTTTSAYKVAWNERVELGVGSSTAAFISMQVDGGPVTTLTPDKRGNAVIFSLPAPPFPFAKLPTLAEYENRGAVHVRVLNARGVELKRRSYRPFGAVVSGQINVLLTQGCASAFSGLPGMTLVGTPAEVGSLCFATLEIGKQGTQNATADLRSHLEEKGISLEAVTVSRNVLYSTDPAGANSTDPTCRQIALWLDPYAENFSLTQRGEIAAQVNARAAHTSGITGKGVTVVVLGTSDGVTDRFSCNLDQDKARQADWTGHDEHVASIISEIAPGATVSQRRVCNPQGCPSSIINARLFSLISEMNSGADTFIVNMSLGGPLPDAVFETLLQQLPFTDPDKFLLVASTGNNGIPTPHYPASNAPGAWPAFNLPNVMSVAALGRVETGSGARYEPALFNTRRNHDVFALGVGICPPSVTFRCNKGGASAYNNHLGLSGTSFANAFVAGVAALYADELSGAPFNLPAVLRANALPVTGLNKGRVWYQ